MSLKIDGGDLWSRLMVMAEIGATPKGGVNRQAFSPEDHEAHRLLAKWAQDAGFHVTTDRIGNLFICREGRNLNAAPVLMGSHLDSQPTGGKFDGAAGVLCAFEVLLAFERAGIATEKPVTCVAWRNEEGSRFQPSCMGSRLFAGEFELEACMAARDSSGISVAEALAQGITDISGSEDMSMPIDAYLELHIEQGPELEQAGLPIGAVTGIQGRQRYHVTVTGSEAHAGTTPADMRQDALKTAATIIHELYEDFPPRDERTRFTVGAMDVFPNSPNTVPGRARFTIDLRHPENEMLQMIGGRIHAICASYSSPCHTEVKQISAAEPVAFPQAMVNMISRHAEALGLGHKLISSGAGHDAAAMASLAPAGMIFIPCRKGLSHNEAEWAESSDIEAGTRVLAACTAELAGAHFR